MQIIILTDEQRDAAMALNHEVAVNPRKIDNPDHPSAGLWMLTARILTDPDYTAWRDWFDHDGTMTVVEASPDDLFLPPPED